MTVDPKDLPPIASLCDVYAARTGGPVSPHGVRAVAIAVVAHEREKMGRRCTNMLMSAADGTMAECGLYWMPAAGLFGTTEETKCPRCVLLERSLLLERGSRPGFTQTENITGERDAVCNGCGAILGDEEGAHDWGDCVAAARNMALEEAATIVDAWLEPFSERTDPGAAGLLLESTTSAVRGALRAVADKIRKGQT